MAKQEQKPKEVLPLTPVPPASPLAIAPLDNEVQNNSLAPHRCVKCDRLLFKGSIGEGGIVEAKCGKCGTVNKFTVDIQNPQNFQERMYVRRRYNQGH